MRTINVSNRFPFAEYDTPEEAINPALNREFFTDIIGPGLPIEQVRWSDTTLALCLTDTRSVVIDALNGLTRCRVLPDWPELESTPETIAIQYHDESAACHTWEDHRDELPNFLTGRTLTMLFANPPATFVYVPDAHPIMVRPLWNMDNDCPLLTWGYAR